MEKKITDDKLKKMENFMFFFGLHDLCVSVQGMLEFVGVHGQHLSSHHYLVPKTVLDQHYPYHLNHFHSLLVLL